MTWNQTPPGGAYDQVMDRLGGQAKPKNERDPFVVAGAHDMIVASVLTFTDKKQGPSVRVTFEYERSTNPAITPGAVGVKLFNLFKPSKYESQNTDADDFVDLVCKLQGVQFGQHADAVRALLKTRAEGGQLELQPARGKRVKVYGEETGNPSAKTGMRYVKLTYGAVAEDMPTIAATRTALDQRRPLGAVMGAPAQAPQQPQGYGAPAGYSQAPQQPQGYAPQGVLAGAPTGYPVQAAPIMSQGPAWTQAPAAPQMPPPGYGAYAQPAPALPQQQAAPGKPPWNPAWGPQPAGY